jgi:ubiquitin-conjugating enzyme E2 Z
MTNARILFSTFWLTNGDRTWRGERGEEWSSAQGLESILISIQSLMSSNPYHNEPGFEESNADGDKKHQKEYVEKV